MVFHCTMCGMGPRSTILLIGILSLIFSAGYVFFTTAGILAHKCDLNMTRTPAEYGIYLYYLRNSNCGPVNLTYLGVHIPAEVPVQVPHVSAAAERTYTFCLVGLVLFGVWFITSFLSLITICTSCIGRCCIAIGLYPYVITLFLVLIYTAIAFVFYMIDFINSFDIDFVMELLEIQNRDQIEPFLDRFDEILLVLPPLVMWLVAGFGVLFWFMFLTFVFVMLGVASRLWAANKPAPSYNRAVQQTRTTVPAATAPVEMREEPRVVHSVPPVAATRYNDPARQLNEPLPYHQLPPSMVDVRRTIVPLKTGHEPTQDLQVSNVPLHDNRNNYPQEPTPPLQPNAMVNPYTDKRFSYMPGHPQPFSYLAGPPSHASSRDSAKLPEVRSQLPWSYFPPVDDSAIPKRVTSTLTEHKEFPGQEVNAPITKASAIDDRSSDEGKWSGPEYRY